MFEAQLLSSLLHLLHVDRYAEEAGSSTTSLEAVYAQGGMNWGNIAVFSCPKACETGAEFVVVQDSVDGRPVQRNEGPELEPTIIPEGTSFPAEDFEESEGDSEAADSCD